MCAVNIFGLLKAQEFYAKRFLLKMTVIVGRNAWKLGSHWAFKAMLLCLQLVLASEGLSFRWDPSLYAWPAMEQADLEGAFAKGSSLASYTFGYITEFSAAWPGWPQKICRRCWWASCRPQNQRDLASVRKCPKPSFIQDRCIHICITSREESASESEPIKHQAEYVLFILFWRWTNSNGITFNFLTEQTCHFSGRAAILRTIGSAW